MMDAVANSYPWNIAGSRVSRSGSFWGAAQISVAVCSRTGSEVCPAASGNPEGHQANQRTEAGTSTADPCDGQPTEGPQPGDGGITETKQCD